MVLEFGPECLSSGLYPCLNTIPSYTFTVREISSTRQSIKNRDLFTSSKLCSHCGPSMHHQQCKKPMKVVNASQAVFSFSLNLGSWGDPFQCTSAVHYFAGSSFCTANKNHHTQAQKAGSPTVPKSKDLEQGRGEKRHKQNNLYS